MAVVEHMTKVELEQRLRLHRNTVSKLLQQGRFPNAFRMGGRWRIPVTDIEAFLRSGIAPAHSVAAFQMGMAS
jgi:excisionase family DNA binding protein